MNNGRKGPVTEHQKNQIDVMENTARAISDYAAVKNIPFHDAAQILVLNELRCIHWHFDIGMRKAEESKK